MIYHIYKSLVDRKKKKKTSLLTIVALVKDMSVGIGTVLGPNDSSHVASTCLEDVKDVVER